LKKYYLFLYKETISYICSKIKPNEKKFEVIFLDEAIQFIEELDRKSRKKIFYNIDKAQYTNDPELFKKLNNLIWEFRIKYNKFQYRILAFWDKTDKESTLVLTTQGFIKKTDKVPKLEIEKAERIRIEYFNSKNKGRAKQ